MLFIEVLKRTKGVINGIDLFACKGKPCLNRNNEFHVLLKKAVDIGLAIKPTVHDQLHFVEAKNREIGEQILHSPDIRNVAWQLPAIEWKTGFFAEHEFQVELRKSVILLVPAILNLTKCLALVGQRGSFISPVFIFGAASPLKRKELISFFFGNVGKEFTVAL